MIQGLLEAKTLTENYDQESEMADEIAKQLSDYDDIIGFMKNFEFNIPLLETVINNSIYNFDVSRIKDVIEIV
jgi:hypothetical protein